MLAEHVKDHCSTPSNYIRRASRASTNFESFHEVVLTPGDLSSFELVLKPQGIVVHLLDYQTEVSFALQDDDIVVTVNEEAVENSELGLADACAGLKSTVPTISLVVKRANLIGSFRTADDADDEFGKDSKSARPSIEGPKEPSDDAILPSVRIQPATPLFPSSSHFTVDIAAAPTDSSLVFTPETSPLPAVEACKVDGSAVLKHRSPLLLRRGVGGFSPVTTGPSSPASSLTIASLMMRRGDSEFSLDSDTTLGSISSSDEFVSSKKGPSMWRKARKIVHVMNFRRKKYPWVQLAGHSDGFKVTDNQSWIHKKGSKYEKLAFTNLMSDVLKPFVPEFLGAVVEHDAEYLQIENLISSFESPNIMDCKMGCRTYLESETDTVTLRKDLLAKMVQIDPHEPSEEEKLNGITKLRYMKFRDDATSSRTLQFRIDACKTRHTESYSLKRLNERTEIMRLFHAFVTNGTNEDKVITSILTRLHALRSTLVQSEFFRHHEVIGSSLLFACDVKGKTGVWMIDFAKTIPREVEIQHNFPWIPSTGSYEDEYLLGLDHVIELFTELRDSI